MGCRRHHQSHHFFHLCLCSSPRCFSQKINNSWSGPSLISHFSFFFHKSLSYFRFELWRENHVHIIVNIKTWSSLWLASLIRSGHSSFFTFPFFRPFSEATVNDGKKNIHESWEGSFRVFWCTTWDHACFGEIRAKKRKMST